MVPNGFSFWDLIYISVKPELSWNNEYQNSQVAADILWHPELSYDNDGTLTINFDYESSDVQNYLSDYAPITRQIAFNISFPEPDNDRFDLERVEIFNEEFNLYDGCEVKFYLHEHDLPQISCALPFRNLGVEDCMFEYYVGNACQDRVDISSEWYAELLLNEDSEADQSDGYDSDDNSFYGGDWDDDDDNDHYHWY
ncbi:hypothetical protein SBOR_0165 [Sclerotinia borealis F-4128]|uniref:Uncharacterized protein n=1 Tax=Sclerotinia borealis (strain F-4128) TaxID=1432307 RepID=W9CTF2_SCLBF|nr:hypothetical protein SBOR_0165 [Sclerotinia borealis F-4128]